VVTNYDDTIVALATAPGNAGIGIVRLSGSNIDEFMRQILGCELIPKQACFKQFLSHDGECIDTGIAIYFPSPESYTGECVLELQGHGGSFILDRVLQRCNDLGARQARPGEFSERAFLNGKMNLTQAEAIADLISSSSLEAARSAMRSLQGDFSKSVELIVANLMETRVFVEAAIDFPEEDIDFLSDPKLLERIIGIEQCLDELLKGARSGVILHEGLSVVLTGKPNVGKSSLMNRLGKEDTAIVASEAGTTRDVIKKRVVMSGVPIQLIDTAGLRETKSEVEKEGIRRAWSEIELADHILLITDSDCCCVQKLESVWPEYCARYPNRTSDVTVVVNKIDSLGCSPGVDHHSSKVRVSAKYNLGIDDLVSQIMKKTGFSNKSEGNLSARRRHLSALNEAKSFVICAKTQLSLNRSGELVAEDLKMAQRELSQITGSISSDELLSEIFSSFCVGK
tara:strand:+ start:2671 stop:4035 length:1365 start_codon:yes stop_codon:yes gene_type:complete